MPLRRLGGAIYDWWTGQGGDVPPAHEQYLAKTRGWEFVPGGQVRELPYRVVGAGPGVGLKKVEKQPWWWRGGRPLAAQATAPGQQQERGGTFVHVLPPGDAFGAAVTSAYQAQIASALARRARANAEVLRQLARLFEAAKLEQPRITARVIPGMEQAYAGGVQAYEDALRQIEEGAARAQATMEAGTRARGGSVARPAGGVVPVGQRPPVQDNIPEYKLNPLQMRWVAENLDKSPHELLSSVIQLEQFAPPDQRRSRLELLAGTTTAHRQLSEARAARAGPQAGQVPTGQAGVTPYEPVHHPVGEAAQGIALTQQLLANRMATGKAALQARGAQEVAAQQEYAGNFARALSALAAREQARAHAASAAAIANAEMAALAQAAGWEMQMQARAQDPMAQMELHLAQRKFQQMMDIEAARQRIRQRGPDAYAAFSELWDKWGGQVAVEAAKAEGEPKIVDWIKIKGGDPKAFGV